MAKLQLDRYDILKNFKLDDEKYIADSTFLHEDNKICEILCAGGFIKARPKIEKITVTANVAPYKNKRYLCNLNWQELVDVAEEEGVYLYPKDKDLSTEKKFMKYWTKPVLRVAIQKKRGKMYVNGRLTRQQST